MVWRERSNRWHRLCEEKGANHLRLPCGSKYSIRGEGYEMKEDLILLIVCYPAWCDTTYVCQSLSYTYKIKGETAVTKLPGKLKSSKNVSGHSLRSFFGFNHLHTGRIGQSNFQVQYRWPIERLSKGGLWKSMATSPSASLSSWVLSFRFELTDVEECQEEEHTVQWHGSETPFTRSPVK